jgi:hypothetical protein
MKAIISFIFLLLIIATGYSQSNAVSVQKPSVGLPTTASLEHEFSISKIFPNPVKDIVTLNIQSEHSGDLKISLYNILGTEVKKWEPQFVHSGEQKLELDFSSFKTGVYILKCTKSGQVQTQVVKKN